MADRVTATPEALELLERLRARHGDLIVHLSGGCCDGSSPICLTVGELPLSPHDLKLGDVAGAGFYIDEELYERWNRPSFVLDVSPGAPEGFSLGAGDTHFVSRPAARRPG